MSTMIIEAFIWETIMKRRIISCCVVILICFSSLTLKLYSITKNEELASNNSSARVKALGENPGNIYDRNGEKMVNRTTDSVALIKPTTENALLVKNLKGEEFAEKTVLKGYFTTVELLNGASIEESENVRIVNTFNRYSDSTALHILGYVDSEGNGVCGVEKYFQKEINLSGGSLSVVYSADAFNRMLISEDIEIRDSNYTTRSGIVLTIDRDIQIIVENAMKNNNIDKGACVVMDVNTAEIIAAASTPAYDRDNLELYLKSTDSPFMNRAFSAFPVGSVFKPVTTIAALEEDIKLTDFVCKGSIEKSGNTFYCNKRDGHGKCNLKDALSQSCNTYFIELSTEVGGKNLLKTATKLGFSIATDFGNGYYTDRGTLPTQKELNSDASVGNLGFGQGKLTATPIQIANFFCTLANGGIYREPSLFLGLRNSSGENVYYDGNDGVKVIKKSSCKAVNEALRETAVSGTGKLAKSEYFDIACKTATAQSGQYGENGVEKKYCWFAGFFPYENPKYAICIMKENGVSGGSDGGPVFKEISENIYFLRSNTF
ncbi:MAG: penicillin-binding protein 2, partial [Oscillospiraceae bacterium]|nr:penicillin-binding protein 2 [Oscillospiraceae bacterium]